MQLLSTTPLKPMILTGIRLFNHAMTTASQHDTVITFPVTSLTVSSHLPFFVDTIGSCPHCKEGQGCGLENEHCGPHSFILHAILLQSITMQIKNFLSHVKNCL